MVIKFSIKKTNFYDKYNFFKPLATHFEKITSVYYKVTSHFDN